MRLLILVGLQALYLFHLTGMGVFGEPDVINSLMNKIVNTQW